MFITSVAIAETWTVDDDGKADFSSIQDAIDGNGIVDVTDLLIVVGNWGPCE
jgi:hypothetical protein